MLHDIDFGELFLLVEKDVCGKECILALDNLWSANIPDVRKLDERDLFTTRPGYQYSLYFFQGIAIVAYWAEKKRFPRILRVLIYTLVALQQFLLLIVIGLEFFDVWLNFRKLEPKENN